MCGIGCVFQLERRPLPWLEQGLAAMNKLLSHRGPDGSGEWLHPESFIGLAHRRLSVIDLVQGQQPMSDDSGNWISFNGEIYNYVELRQELGPENFQTTSDTEVILRAYQRWGIKCLDRLRGMFAFALWDERQQRLFCARDRFGIKPLYYSRIRNTLVLASEVKAILPFLDQVSVDDKGLQDYLAFQFYLEGKTLFANISELQPAHYLIADPQGIKIERYWQVYYDLDFAHTERYFYEQIQQLLQDSVAYHLRSDVPVGAYLSGGIDSSLVAALAAQQTEAPLRAYTGKFLDGPDFDESAYARDLAQMYKIELQEVAIGSDDFLNTIHNLIYHLDYPIAGPGSFPQYMVSGLVRQTGGKVVLGGQGGDEIFGGYARYLIAYFEQCIKAAIDGTMNNGNFVVTYESILPNLVSLKSYKPLLKEFWRDGLFSDLDQRYFRLINRANDFTDELKFFDSDYIPFEKFQELFLAPNVKKESYFDSMTHFDFKTLLPALLQVEDRVSMAHGVESRVPFLDHPLVEMAATMPADVKFKHGNMKHALKQSMGDYLPNSIRQRTDKMGFPVPLNNWLKQDLRPFVHDVFSSSRARQRGFYNSQNILAKLDQESGFSRRLWGLMCLELWHTTFIDRFSEFKQSLKGSCL